MTDGLKDEPEKPDAVIEGGEMTLEGVGVTQPAKHGPMQLRLKFGKQAYCVIELRKGDEAAEVARKLRELADQVAEKS